MLNVCYHKVKQNGPENANLGEWALIHSRLQSGDNTSDGSKCADVPDKGRISIAFNQLIKRSLEPLFTFCGGSSHLCRDLFLSL